MKLPPRVTALLALSMFGSAALADVVSDASSVAGFDASDDSKDWSGMLGLAALSSPEYIGSEDDETTGAPVIIVDYKDTAYFRVDRAGYWFWKPNESFRVGALIKLRPGAWEDDDDSIEDLGALPAGFDEPDAQAEPGLNLKWHRDMLTAELEVTSGEDTNVGGKLSYRFMLSERSSLIARIGFEILGEDEVNYQWYGDTSGADVDSATNTSLALIELKQRERGLANLGVDFGATDFPAVAGALGGKGVAVRDRPALAAALEDGLAVTDGFTVIAAEIGPQTYDGRF